MSMNRNIAFITLDSLRWDAAINAETPNLKKLFKRLKIGWHKVYAQATYTLPAHVAMFHDGHLPTNDVEIKTPKDYSRRNKYRVFNINLGWNRKREFRFQVPEARNLIKGYETLGYRTVGIGGVKWFCTTLPTTNLWFEYFQEFYWKREFAEENPDAFDEQIVLSKTLLNNEKGPIVFFLNIPSCHRPCRKNNNLKGQSLALNYIDSKIPQIFELLPRPVTIFLMSDHGTCFDEDGGLRGHGFYHPKVMEIPMTIIDLEN